MLGLLLSAYLHFLCPPPPCTSLLPPLINLVRNPNNAASRSPTRIARFKTVLMSALPQVIRTRMHNDGAAQHGLLADQLDQAILDAALGVAAAVGLEVAEVADVAGLVGGGTGRVGLVGGLYGETMHEEQLHYHATPTRRS